MKSLSREEFEKRYPAIRNDRENSLTGQSLSKDEFKKRYGFNMLHRRTDGLPGDKVNFREGTPLEHDASFIANVATHIPAAMASTVRIGRASCRERVYVLV